MSQNPLSVGTVSIGPVGTDPSVAEWAQIGTLVGGIDFTGADCDNDPHAPDLDSVLRTEAEATMSFSADGLSAATLEAIYGVAVKPAHPGFRVQTSKVLPPGAILVIGEDTLMVSTAPYTKAMEAGEWARWYVRHLFGEAGIMDWLGLPVGPEPLRGRPPSRNRNRVTMISTGTITADGISITPDGVTVTGHLTPSLSPRSDYARLVEAFA